MKKKLFIFPLLIAAFFAFAPKKGVEIGETAEGLHHKVTELDGDEKMLREYLKPQGLLVVFSCNTCPFVEAWEDRYNEIHEMAKNEEIGMVLINSNEAFRGDEDSPENMKAHALEEGYTMPYVIDKDHKIADAFGAKTTPHVFLLNRNLKLVYKGAIDDNYENKDEVKKQYLKDAITAMASGKEISPQTSKALGCSIKRVKK
ncbi:thioredoxin family protein [Salibacter sp.]|uniref:thioredoxin family protein n=1 Tax=Salibacter sp. TaxID=2010995 RepID=UPI0028705469|nr:thioredoxin family protein [Salibacter sp.]MDR9399424.1 thioredoxin family protein [Salibacter sp.]MDR9486748.1 thioredoxin family protein [Salibacter sp.]